MRRQDSKILVGRIVEAQWRDSRQKTQPSAGARRMKELISSWRPWAYPAWTLRACGFRTPGQLETAYWGSEFV